MRKRFFLYLNTGGGAGDHRHGQQAEAPPEEVAARRAALKTQGRKGAKAIRINLAFTPENHEFVKIMAKATGKTMTEFTNIVIAAYRREHPEIMERAKGFLDFVNSGTFTDEGKD